MSQSTCANILTAMISLYSGKIGLTAVLPVPGNAILIKAYFRKHHMVILVLPCLVSLHVGKKIRHLEIVVSPWH